MTLKFNLSKELSINYAKLLGTGRKSAGKYPKKTY